MDSTTLKIRCKVLLVFIFLLSNNLYSQEFNTSRDYTMGFVFDRIGNDLDLGLITYEQAQTALNNLQYLLDNPIDINTATKEDLLNIPLISEFQVNQFIIYRTNIGGQFENLYDIKSIPSWDEELISWIPPLLCISKVEEKEGSLYNYFYGSKINASMVYTYDNIKRNLKILGSPYAITLKTSVSNKNKFEVFLSAQKDKGEQLGKTISNIMDSYSFSVGIYNAIKNTRFTVGDYRTSWGSGLIISQNFNIKSYSSFSSINTNRGITTVKGAVESNFSRGLSAEFSLGKFKTTLISALQNMDGKVSDDGFITSFYQTGLHRTEEELFRKSAVKMRMIGISASYSFKYIDIIASSLYYDWNGLKLRTPRGTSNIEELQNIDKMKNYSLSYVYHPLVKKIILQGELASNSANGFATIHNCQYQNDKIGNINACVRYASPTYWSYYSSSQYYSSNRVNNQWGYSIEYQPPLKVQNTTLTLFYDKYRSLRYLGRRSSTDECQTYYLSIRSRIFQNIDINTSLLFQDKYDNGKRIRYKLNGVFSKNNIDYLACFDFNATKKTPGSDYSFGKMITLGANINNNERLKIKTRLSFFNTDGFYNRIFYYYPRVAGDYTPIFISGKGYRLAIFGSSKINKYLKIEANVSLQKQVSETPDFFFGLSISYNN